MKKVIFVSSLLFSNLGFSQHTNQPIVVSDSSSVSIVKEMGYDPKVFGDETAEMSKTWTAEEKEWFKSTFIYKRGGFTVPEKPISYPLSKD